MAAPHPACLVPAPAEELVTVVEAYAPELQGFQLADQWLVGKVFMDGSVDPHPARDMRRAHWAFTLPNADSGHSRLAVRGAAPGSLPQTAQSAEYTAYVALGAGWQG